MELNQRERKVDVSKMSEEDVANLSSQIGDKVRNITDEAAKKVNSILAIYGMSAKIAIAFDTLPKNMEKNFKSPKKNKKTKNNLK